MPRLLLRTSCIGTIDAVLFDKDGTLSHSEPHLLSLARRRIDTAARLWRERCPEQSMEAQLRDGLRHAFGIIPEGLRPDGERVHEPRDIGALAWRQRMLRGTLSLGLR